MADYSNSTGLPQELIDLLGDPRQQIQDQAQQQRLGMSLPASPVAVPAPQVNAVVPGVASPSPSETAGGQDSSDEEDAPKPQSTTDSKDSSDEDGSGDSTAPSAPPSVRDYLMQKYGFGPGMDTAALAKAQKQAQNTKYEALMEEGLSKIGSAFSRGQVTPDHNFYQQLGQAGQAPVQNILAQRAAQTQGLQNEAAVNTQANTQQLQDPNSPQSKVLQTAIGKLYPGKFGPEELAQVSASDMDLLFKPLQLQEQIESRKEIAKGRLTMQQAMMHNKQGTQDIKYDVESDKELQHNKEFTAANTRVQAAPRLLELASQATAGAGNQPANQLARQALATELGLYISGGQRLHTSTVDAMGMTHGAFMTRLQQSLSDASTGGLSPENAKFVHDFVQHEAQASAQEVQAIKGQRATDFQNIHGRAPRWATPTANGQQTPTPAAPPTNSAFSQDVLAYAQSHNITPQQAMQIKIQRTGGQQ